MSEAPRSAVSLAGRLDDIELPELLQFLATNRKSGRLTLSRRDGHGVVLVRAGRILYAASNSVRETLGNLLVQRGLVDEASLLDAIEQQHWAREPKRLGEILVERGRLAEDALEDVIKDQMRTVLQELFSWSTGFFKFESLALPDRGEVEVDAREFLVLKGINTDEVLLEAVRRLDESGIALPSAATPEPAAPGMPAAPAPLEALGAPALRGEVTLRLMHVGARAVARGVLLAVRGDDAHGVGHFGMTPAGTGRGGKIQVSLAEATVLLAALNRKEPQVGAAEPGPANERFLAQLGGGAPIESVVVPMVVGGRVAMLFYGDNLPEAKAIGPIDELVRAVLEASLAMEKEALDERLRDYDRRYKP
jgi:hypothetical protein